LPPFFILLIWEVNHSTGAFPIPLYICAPFFILILAMAVLPQLWPEFWERDLNKLMIAVLCALPIVVFFGTGSSRQLVAAIDEYLAFIVLIGALFVITGGIVLEGDLPGTPAANTIFLLVGAVIANFIGTTGSSMLLIRPWLKMNCQRHYTRHLPVFFIFLVSNIGGALTPLGDPPLFLGYLRGVPFEWNLNLFPHWGITIALLLTTFYLWDTRCFKREPEQIRKGLRFPFRFCSIRITGAFNLWLLLAVIAVILLRVITPWREMIMIMLALISLGFTPGSLRSKNRFTWHPLIEVAMLFAGLFITMRPVMMILEAKGAAFGINQPWQFFWLVGGLSSFLDNAPTYATFFALATNVTRTISDGFPVIAGVRGDLLVAISCGAVFMGANSYIGNGPNLMVRSIAEAQDFETPQFFEYLGYSFAILVPVFLVLTGLFFI
ncbi:MAG TPA: sodium:proton antiporter, partial [Bacillota bacterium]